MAEVASMRLRVIGMLATLLHFYCIGLNSFQPINIRVLKSLYDV